MSLFTSLYTGVHDVGFPTQRLAAVIPTLPELLADAGYVTGAVTDNGMLSRGAGFGRGFDEYREFKDRSADYEGAIVRSVAEALRFVADHRDERFFLFLHTYQVHTPFAPPKKYDVFRAGSNPRSAEGLQGLYAGEVRYTDDILSALFGQIEKLGLGEETLVVVTSDHGEAFGEHGHWGHSISLYEEEIRVPLLWWGPGLVQPGTRLAAPTSLVDVPPTLLELVGAEALRWSQGQSLAAVLQGQPDAATDGERYAENRRKHAKQGSVAVRSSQHKWIRKGNEEEVEVYDLLEDSSEAEPLDDIELMAQGQALIQIFDEESAELRAAIAQAGSGEAAAPNVLDGETVERLRELGYVE